MKKLTKEQTEQKTARFRATMARKRAAKEQANGGRVVRLNTGEVVKLDTLVPGRHRRNVVPGRNVAPASSMLELHIGDWIISLRPRRGGQ